MKGLITILLCAFFASELCANYPPTPHGMKGYWESDEPKGKRQFRMMPYGFDEKTDHYYHRNFPNGLYADKDANTPLWSVDFFEESICWARSHEERAYFPLYLSQDCRFLARLTASAQNGSDTVLRFYENGKLTKSYTLVEVLGQDRTEDAIRSEVWFKEVAFDATDSGALEIQTHLLEFGGETIRIGMSSGKIESRETFVIARKSGWRAITFFVGVFLTVVLGFTLVFWRVARPPAIVQAKS